MTTANHEKEPPARPRKACGRCGETQEAHPEMTLPPGYRENEKWLHVRSGLFECQPRCTFEDCDAVAVTTLGFHGFDGGGSRFIRTGYRCAEHRQGGTQWT